MELYVKNEWVYRLYMSPYRNHSLGAMILINNTFEYEVERIRKVPNCNFIIIELIISGKT